MAQSDDEKQPGSKKPPENLSLRKSRQVDQKQFQSMTDLAAKEQAATFEIIEEEAVLASKRVKPDLPNPHEKALEHYLQPPPDQFRRNRQEEGALPRDLLARDLERACLTLLQSLGENVNLTHHGSEDEKRLALLRAVRAIVSDPTVTGPIATLAALTAGYYHNSQTSLEPTLEDSETFAYFAADRFSLLEGKRLEGALLPDKQGFLEAGEEIVAGFAPSQNFLLAFLFSCLPCATADLKTRIKPLENGYLVTFPGAAPLKVSPLSQGERCYGACDLRGFDYLAILEKAYGQHLTEKLTEPLKPVIAADGAKAAADTAHCHLALNLLTGRAPLVMAKPMNEKAAALWRKEIEDRLRQSRQTNSTMYCRRLSETGAPLDCALKFEMGQLTQYYFDRLCRLRSDILPLSALFDGAQVFYQAG
ncbi:MAG TPA: hypothetical protein PLC15_03975 [Candidatus Obscuribacter sp.]|nr:hypothetical protein [Candidatus Obscuribacter sp.]HNB14509.1 hypothetical protein [Candidatus Obscuribacter sp.]HND04862.1 hypothetical protein [Candidatus Obscuribacter sp.]HNG18014.1 hypothetical protein [Candidatus Obscuribacter sp.]